jgi:photosystem II stability/assembly factor-like uncharacterized protein
VNKKFWCVLTVLLVLVNLLFVNVKAVIADEVGSWSKIELPTTSTLLDLAFTGSDTQHGWLVGAEGTILETNNAGNTWEIRHLDLGDGNYRFMSVSFSGNEGWIAGKPSLLLHTVDGGQSWARIALSSKLPGDPMLVKALGPNSAEMATDIGAIYRTQDAGQNWKAMVTQAVGAVRNLNRNEDGRYIAVSAKGNFYSTWQPGDAAWVQHNRNSSRRVQNMGYGPDGRTWMLNRGGQLQFSKVDTIDEWEKPQFPRDAEGYGMLDLAYQDLDNIWVAAGSSKLLHSEDRGETWHKENDLEGVGANFYKVIFLGQNRGFILGQSGTLLAYSRP